jgi:succinate-semialdehyde dehydrogenase/glutarate-semialdehyde dehydrogenase
VTLTHTAAVPANGPDAELLGRLLTLPTGTAGTSIGVWSPVTGDPIAQIPESTPDDVGAAFARARAAQRQWADRPLRERSAVMLRLHDLLLRHRDEGLDLVQWETGKARRDALEELLDICVNARHYARDAARLLSPRRQRGAFPLVTGVRELRHPKGIVGIIAPWNYPLTLAASDAVPALLAGNGVVLKPDSKTTLTSLWVADLMYRAGVPRDLFAVVAGSGAILGAPIVANCDFLMFTGSTRTGRMLAAACGQRLIGCSMELGGKNAMIVCDDVGVGRAVDIAARASFANAGQLCVSMERLYVQRGIWDEFVPALVRRVSGLRISPAIGWGADIGSLISAEQLDNVSHHVDDAVAKGAVVLAGGRARPDLGPYCYEPTLLAGVAPGMAVCREETFGPVVALYPFDTDGEAVAAANDTRYGLNAAVLSGSAARGTRIARQLRAGTVNVNEGYAAGWGATRAPMGGMGESGIGRRHGDEGLLKYTESQTVAVQRLLGYHPHFGLSDRRWGGMLTAVARGMKAAHLK